MILHYTVQGVHETDAELDVALADGRSVKARVPSLVVDMVSECGGMGHTFRLQPADMDAAKALFVVGHMIEVSFAAPALELTEVAA